MRIAEMRLTGLFFAVAFAEPSMDLGTGAVAKEDVDRRVEREEVEDELKDLQHLVKTRGYIAQLEQDVKGLREELGSAGPDAEAPGMQGGGGMEGDNICPSPTLAGRKRQRGESDVQGREDAGKSMCTALGGPRQAPSDDSADQELPGVCLPAFLFPTDGDMTHFCSIPEGNRHES